MCKVLLGCKQKSETYSLQDGYDSKEYVGRKDLGGASVDKNYHAIVVRSPDQILPYCIISAEYPNTVKIGGRGMSAKQLQDARKNK